MCTAEKEPTNRYPAVKYRENPQGVNCFRFSETHLHNPKSFEFLLTCKSFFLESSDKCDGQDSIILKLTFSKTFRIAGFLDLSGMQTYLES